MENLKIFKFKKKIKKEKKKKKERKISVYQHCAGQAKYINTSVGQTWQVCYSCLPITAADVVFQN